MPIPDPHSRRPPELIAPAGGWAALRAAAANGADAVYFGLRDFNARLRAANFTAEELPEVIGYLHGHNVRGYVTLNTLVFSDELDRAAECLAAIAEAGADAVVVQDLGIVRLARRLAPSLPVHASTQMTLTEPRGIAIARELGIRRVILARELSLNELRGIAASLLASSSSSFSSSSSTPPPEDQESRTTTRTRTSTIGEGGSSPVELEVFVHGALCVSYSGQCLASLVMGGRSGNRGQCAQACRLPYTMIVDGKPLDQGGRAHLLSPKDLAAYDRIEALVGLGVAGFKIEGRLKSAAYVAAATRVYRAALDAALAKRRFALSPEQEAELAQGFSRGFTRGFLDGADHQELVPGRSPKSRGLHIGTVVGKSHGGIVIELSTSPPAGFRARGRVSGGDLRVTSRGDRNPREGASPRVTETSPLKPGDGVVFEAARAGEDDEPGGRIMAVRPVAGQSGRVEIAFRRGDVRLSDVSVGSAVWKTDDPEVQRRLEQSYARDRVWRPVPLSARVWAEMGQPLRIVLRDDAGHAVTRVGGRPLERAEKHPLTLDLLREQLGRLGGTPFELRGVEVEKLDPVMVPKSVLNDLRRKAIEALLKLRAGAARHRIAEPDALARLRGEIEARSQQIGTVTYFGAQKIGDCPYLLRPYLLLPTDAPPRLTVLVRDPAQLGAVLAWSPPERALRPALVYCEFADARLCRDAVAQCRSAGVAAGLATLRIVKPGEDPSLEQILDESPDAVLVRNLAGVSFFHERAPVLPLVGDFSLNIANDLAASVAVELGLARIVPSADLAWSQMAAMARRFRPGLFEVILHQHVPMFHTEHCLFAASLSRGRDRRECGRPCRRRVELRDRTGAEHPVACDAACRNTVFHAIAQSAAGSVGDMKRMGIRHFRIDLLHESPEEVRALLDCYARLLAGLDDARTAWRRLRDLCPGGLAAGTGRSPS
jgi:putative protease